MLNKADNAKRTNSVEDCKQVYYPYCQRVPFLIMYLKDFSTTEGTINKYFGYYMAWLIYSIWQINWSNIVVVVKTRFLCFTLVEG